MSVKLVMHNDSEILKELDDGLEEVIDEVGMRLKEHIRKNMKRRGGIPAPPGEFPGVRTGSLKNSIVYKKEHRNGNLVLEVGIDEAILKSLSGRKKNYGIYLEEGTSKMAPRPFLAPTFFNLRQIVGDLLEGRQKPRGIGGFFSRLKQKIFSWFKF